jgi:ZIP family zinc transporter
LSFAQTALLGAAAGLTIFLGLPLARLRRLPPAGLAFCNALAVGILHFLFLDVLGSATEPIRDALAHGRPATGLIAVLLLAFAGSLLSLVYFGQHFLSGGGGDGRAPVRLALLIAVGIGLHNFSEGLAIGSSARAGALALALTLIVGFGLHNVTEAFGVVAPLAGRPVGGGVLAGLGLVAGGPTLLGTLVGYRFAATPLSVLFLALAGGAIVYVLGELLAAGRRLASPAWSGWGLVVGFAAALLTDFILTAGGA